MIASSNYIENLQVPMLLVELVLKRFGEIEEKRIDIELTKEELDEFL